MLEGYLGVDIYVFWVKEFQGNDLEFQGHAIEIETFNYHHWIP